MFIRVQYPKNPSEAAQLIHTYQVNDYLVTYKDDGSIRLFLDGAAHEIAANPGVDIFIMNDNGKTIDRINV